MVDIPLAVVGVDFRRASTRWRAELALDGPGRRELHAALVAQGATGLASLSTCNRTEWIAAGRDPRWLAQLLRAEAIERLQRYAPDAPEPFVLEGAAAAEHVLRVALGLQSLAVGERHIARQMHEAFSAAREEQTACGVLNVLETVVGRTVRRASRLPRGRSQGAGMHRLAAEALARALRPTPDPLPVLVIGMGAIGRKVAERIAQDRPVIRVNRTPRAGWLALDAARAAPPPHRAVVLCSGAREAIWGPDQLLPTTEVVIDIGSPAQFAGPVVGPGPVPVLDLDALVAAATPVDLPPLDGAVDAGMEDLRRALGVRAYRELVRVSRDAYQELSRQTLPQALDRFPLSPRDRERLEAEVRGMLRGYAERMLDATLQLSQEEP